MQKPEDADVISTLHSKGWGTKWIAAALGISRNTVKRYLKEGWKPYTSRANAALSPLKDWLKEAFEQHNGNADVIRQELLHQHGLQISLRSVQRAVKELRDHALATAKATLRFETLPGQQLQIDFGSTKISIGDQVLKVYLFTAILGFSRRIYVAPFLHERQSAWFKGIEGAFQYFGGITEQILLDNAKALVKTHSMTTGEIIFNERFHSFACYWGFRPVACAPYRARTKGKDERAVAYVKHNAVAGRVFLNWEAFEAHLNRWMLEVADVRIHGTTGDKPSQRFLEHEMNALKPLPHKPPFLQMRQFRRVVHTDACVEVDTNRYSVPWELIGSQVTVEIVDHTVVVFHQDEEVARHPQCDGKRDQKIIKEHLKGIIGALPRQKEKAKPQEPVLQNCRESSLGRPLSEYAALVGGGW